MIAMKKLTKLEVAIHALAVNGHELNYACAALTRYNRRRDRLEHPEGHCDGAGRWYPAGKDKEVCGWAREPSRQWPWSYLKEACTLTACQMYDNAYHSAVLTVRRWLTAEGVDWKTQYDATHLLRSIRNAMRAARFQTIETKQVAPAGTDAPLAANDGSNAQPVAANDSGPEGQAA